MPPAGAVTLRDLKLSGDGFVAIECAPCARRGRYSVDKLLQAHGDLTLPDLLAVLTEGCPKRVAAKPFDMCRATFVGLTDAPRAANETRAR